MYVSTVKNFIKLQRFTSTTRKMKLNGNSLCATKTLQYATSDWIIWNTSLLYFSHTSFSPVNKILKYSCEGGLVGEVTGCDATLLRYCFNYHEKSQPQKQKLPW